MSWSLDGVNLSTLAINIKHRAAGWSMPSKSGSNIKVPGKHGTFFKAKTYDEGHLTLSMWAAGCNDDGTLPSSEDGSKKVRDNLDKLSSLFSTNNRLLCLRKRIGTDMPLINEITNPQMVSTSNTGIALATDYLVNSDRGTQVSTEISRNIAENPYFKGRNTSERVVTEDVFPDPALWQHSRDSVSSLTRGYFYPVNQDEPFTNFFSTPFNGFSYVTNSSGRGVISINRATPVWPTAHIAYIGRHVEASRRDKVFGFFRLRLASNAVAEEVSIRVTPSVSLDKNVWTNGTSVALPVDKDGFTEIMVPASYLPEMANPTSSGFHVRYLLTVASSANWRAGEAIEVSRIAIQDSPEAGNPWVGHVGNEHIVVGGQTPYIRYEGSSRRSVSSFAQRPVPGWEKVNTGNRSTTAPYAHVWNVEAGRYDEAQYAFSVFGGTQQTFRKVLPTPVRGGSDYRIWGKSWYNITAPSTIRIVRRTGVEGSYAYTQVGTVSVSGNTFVSPSFTLTPGETYCMEVTVPSGDGFVPPLVLREIHVSNGLADTRLPWNTPRQTKGNAYRAQFVGTIYNSPVHAFAYKPALMEEGLPNLNAQSYLTKNINWQTQSDGAFVSPALDLVSQELPLPSNMPLRDLSVIFTAAIAPMEHLKDSRFSPGTATLNLSFRVTNPNHAGGFRTVNRSFSGVTPVRKSFNTSFPLEEGDTRVKATASYSSTTHPLSTIDLRSLHLMVNKPIDAVFFTGAAGYDGIPWSTSATWRGMPYFSPTSLSSSLPSGWAIDVFEGYDESTASLKFKGTRVRIPAVLPAGQAYIGFRRGASASFQVQVQTQGMSSPVSLGSVSGSVGHVQSLVTLPQASSYVDFVFTNPDQLKSVRDVFAIANWSSVYPIPSSSWAGFNSTTTPSLVFPAHPSHLYPLTRVRKLPNGTSEFSTGAVPGWTGPVLHGGYLQVPKSGTQHEIASNQVRINGGYLSTGIRIQTTPDAVDRVHIEIQAATASDALNGEWSTVRSHTVNSSSYHEVKIVDVNVFGMDRARLVIRVDNTSSPLNRSGITGIVDGVAFTPTPLPVGGNYPGYFVGVRASNGTSAYRGDIRQCWVEVNETIDMDSMAYGTIAEFNVLMTVPGAFWEDVYDTQTTVAAQGSATSGMFILSDFEGATAPMSDLTYEVEPVSGTITDLRLEDMASGSYLVYKGPARTKITIDPHMATVTDETGNSIIQHIPQIGSSTLLSVSPYRKTEGEVIQRHRDGVPVLKWSSNRPLRITVTGRRKYLIG